MVVEPCLPSTVAVIVTRPLPPTAATFPLASTVAIEGLLDVQVMRRFCSMCPPPHTTAETLVVDGPSERLIEELAAVTTTESTGTSATVRVALALTFSAVLVTLIAVVPESSAVTKPVPLTLATRGTFDVQLTARPLSTIPVALLVVSEKVMVSPTNNAFVVGEITIDATGIGTTVMVAVPDAPSLAPVIVALPAVRP